MSKAEFPELFRQLALINPAEGKPWVSTVYPVAELWVTQPRGTALFLTVRQIRTLPTGGAGGLHRVATVTMDVILTDWPTSSTPGEPEPAEGA